MDWVPFRFGSPLDGSPLVLGPLFWVPFGFGSPLDGSPFLGPLLTGPLFVGPLWYETQSSTFQTKSKVGHKKNFYILNGIMFGLVFAYGNFYLAKIEDFLSTPKFHHL